MDRNHQGHRGAPAVRALSLVALLACTGCSVFLPARGDTFVTENQVVKLRMEGELPALERGEEPKEVKMAFASAMVPIAVDFVAAQVASAIDADQTHYTATYGASLRCSDFWKQAGTPPAVVPSYEALVLSRAAGRVTDGEDLACRLELGITPIDAEKGVFSLDVHQMQIARARAKVLGWNLVSFPSWFMPKSDTLDVSVSVAITTHSVDDKGKLVSDEAKLALTLTDYDLEKRPLLHAPGSLGVFQLKRWSGKGAQPIFGFKVTVTEADPLHAQHKPDALKELVKAIAKEAKAGA